MSDAGISMRRLGRHTLVYGIGSVISRIASFIMLPFYTRYLTPGDYGVMQLVEMTLEIVAILAGNRIASGVFLYYQRAQDDQDRKTVLSTASIMLFLSFGAFGLLTAAAAPQLSRVVFGVADYARLIQLSAATMAMQALVTVPLALLRIEGRSARFVGIATAKMIIQIVLNIVFLAWLRTGVEGVFVSTLIANTLIALYLAVPFVVRFGLGFSPRWARTLLWFGVPLMGTHLASFVTTFADRYFLRVSGDVAAVGIYSLAYQFGFVLSYMTYAPFASVWEPMRFQVAVRADRDQLFSRAFLYLNLLLLSFALAIALGVGDFIRIMSAPAFWPAADLVPVILVAYVLQSWSSFQEVGILVKERTFFSTLSNWVGAGTALAGYALLVPRYLGWGAAWATVLAFTARQVTTYVASQRLFPLRYAWAPVWRLVVLALVIFGVATQLPRDVLWQSIVLRGALFPAYLVLAWFLVLPADERGRFAGLARDVLARLRALPVRRPAV